MGTIGDGWGQMGANTNPYLAIFSTEFSDVLLVKLATWGSFPTHKLQLEHLQTYRSRIKASSEHGDFCIFAFLEVLVEPLQRGRNYIFVSKTSTDSSQIFHTSGSP